MKIAFYAPFKPLRHKNPSGDLAIARGIVAFLEEKGHTIFVPSTLRARWIYWKPWVWPRLIRDLIHTFRELKKKPPDIWLTYHTYYKAPDLLGPLVCRILGIRYFIFQGIYSTKRKRRFATFPGFYLNRMALRRAHHVFTNKLSDLKNLKRIIPGNRLTYIRPGIQTDAFIRDQAKGEQQKKQWGISATPVILTAAMFRDDVKTKGLAWLIRCCGGLVKEGVDFHLVIAGSGKMEKNLKQIAREYIPGHYTFAGKIPREKMSVFYSAGDLFAFPGIRESLGMVYLEAQSCSLPVVAFKNGGIPEVVADRKTGFLVLPYDSTGFSDKLIHLTGNEALRRKMGAEAEKHVKTCHDIGENYEKFEQLLCESVDPSVKVLTPVLRC